MKKFFNENFIISIRVNSIDPISGINKIFASGADAAIISCLSGQKFYLIDPADVNKEKVAAGTAALEDIFSSFKSGKFIIQIYGVDDCSEDLKLLVEKYSMQENILLWTQDSGLMKKIRLKLPSAATAMTPYEFLYAYFLFKTGFLYFKKKFRSDCLISSESAGISYILNEGMISQLNKRGIFSIALTDSSEKQMKRLFDSGCRGFAINDIKAAENLKKLFSMN